MNSSNDYVCDLLQLIDIYIYIYICMPTELAHNLKETPQAVLVCQQRWHGASHNPFAMHVHMHIYIGVYIYICIYIYMYIYIFENHK